MTVKKGSISCQMANRAQFLVLLGVACWVIVLLTHVAERLHIFPSMGWGLPDSPGHYLDLVSAIVGCVALLAALALRVGGGRLTR